ncbi:MAG: hypothetical protein WCO00_03345 [Rhodospirillaceae bacterium]
MTEFRSLRRLRHRLSGLPRFAVIPALMLGLTLGGCAGDPDPVKVNAMIRNQLEEQTRVQLGEYQSILTELRRTSMCVTTVEVKPEFKRLQAHGSNDGDTPPAPAKLIDPHKATAKERKLIAAFLEAMAPCQPQFAPMATPSNRNIVRVITETWEAQRELYGELKEGRMNWGSFNRGTRANSDKLAGAIKALRLTNEG